MPVLSHLDPFPSLAGADYRPAKDIAVPVVNSVDNQPYQGGSKIQSLDENRENGQWLRMARNAYESSESWLQVNQRAIWARNFAHYRSEHAPDSPVLADANKHRAKHFWPKTRTLVRDIQAAAAEAYFASADIVALEAENSDDQRQVDAACLIKELVNYRLMHTIPWYQITLGGIQEASVLGTVVSHQSWEYREEIIIHGQETDLLTGDVYEIFETKTLADKPKIRIVPAENIRISPAADWLDPANSSPYLIELIPMYLCDVMTRIREGGESKTGEPSWKDIGENFLMSAGNRDNLDATRRSRSGNRRLDPKSNMMEANPEFRIVWVHRNIIRHNGKDWLYYTAGTHALLSDPVLLEDVLPWADGKRDYVFGKLEIETDRPYPSGPVEILGGLQKAFNELNNQRYDNVRQVLNRRYLYRAGQQVDVRALGRNVPGGLIGISAPGPLDSHVSPLPVQDVTSSSFQEGDRLALAMDDLTGSTTVSTVNSNRRLHETATGMSLMAESGNRIRAMELRTFTETWMEPVIRQVVQLIAMYETDETALTVAAKKANLLKILPEYFDYKFSVSINVGMGATSPTQRMQRIQGAIATVVGLVPDAAAAVNGPEVAKEVFGAAGFDNGGRFFNFAKVEAQKQNPEADPAMQLQQMQLQQKAEADKAKMELAQAKLQLEQQKQEMENAKLAMQVKEIAAKIDLITAQTTVQNTTAVFEASQAAATVAQNPGLAPSTDEILASSGFKDHNKPPVILAPEQPIAVTPPEVENTHPNYPPTPAAANAGIKAGLQTPRIEAQ